MYSQMVLFVTTLTLLFSPIITLEALTLFEIPTTIKGEVVENTLPFYVSEKLEQDYTELGEKGIRYFTHKYWMKKRAPSKLHSASSTEISSRTALEEQIPDTPKNELRNESMKQFIAICTQSFANVKLDYLIACVLEGFKSQ
ncbi:hypothetical protein WA026_015193 [Henosepilachna vigintioctopunctata]|uniref:Uncharacterized protein n=1 Tax=Henosepilachna vigintioctopunctata TaxID=420089 RepID=A0AAW1TU88_9CUCU